MSAYDELVERCTGIDASDTIAWPWNEMKTLPRKLIARTILAEVLHTLLTVTPEMVSAAGITANGEFAKAYLDMLRASPIAPTED